MELPPRERNIWINKIDLCEMGSGSHLAYKAGKALQVSPAPLLCKWAPIKQAAPCSGSPCSPPPSPKPPEPLAARRKAQPTRSLLQLLHHSHSLFFTHTARPKGLLNSCVLSCRLRCVLAFAFLRVFSALKHFSLLSAPDKCQRGGGAASPCRLDLCLLQ